MHSQESTVLSYLESEKKERILFVEKEVFKIHRNFSHRCTENLFILLKFARPGETDQRTKEIQACIAKKCDTCQSFNSPLRHQLDLNKLSQEKNN